MNIVRKVVFSKNNFRTTKNKKIETLYNYKPKI